MNLASRFLSAADVFLVLAALAPPVRAVDDMPHNDMPHNSVSLAGLTKAASLLGALAKGPLDDATIKGAFTLSPSVLDTDVAKLLDKIVSCALDRNIELKPFPVKDATGGNGNGSATTRLAGELGLCGSRSIFGDWHTAALSGSALRSCQEAVTACVLARVNALGHRIVISIRTQANLPIALHAQVPVETQYRDHKPIPIFAPCTGSGSDCGYERQFVGRCTANQNIRVRVTDNSPHNTKIRICRGLYGCEKSVPKPYRKYSHRLAERVDVAPFVCPSDGPQIGTERWGYYSVMTKPGSPGSVVVQASSGDYPAREEAVFTWPEGAFYGNIFNTELTARVASQCPDADKRDPVLAGDQHACFGPMWEHGVGVGQMNDRFCAIPPFAPVPASACFATPPMACFLGAGDRCATNALSSGAFGDCKPTKFPSAESVFNLAITTYLNDPCDLSSDTCDPDKVVARYRPGADKHEVAAASDPDGEAPAAPAK